MQLEDEFKGSMDSLPEKALQQLDGLKRMGVDRRVTIRYRNEIHPDPKGTGCFLQHVLALLHYMPRRPPRRKVLHAILDDWECCPCSRCVTENDVVVFYPQ